VLIQAPAKELLADPEMATLLFGGAVAEPPVGGGERAEEDEPACIH
jgi:hypothetical protein